MMFRKGKIKTLITFCNCILCVFDTTLIGPDFGFYNADTIDNHNHVLWARVKYLCSIKLWEGGRTFDRKPDLDKTGLFKGIMITFDFRNVWDTLSCAFIYLFDLMYKISNKFTQDLILFLSFCSLYWMKACMTLISTLVVPLECALQPKM